MGSDPMRIGFMLDLLANMVIEGEDLSTEEMEFALPLIDALAS